MAPDNSGRIGCVRANERESSGLRGGVGLAVSAALLVAVLGVAATRAPAEEIRFFRIGTGAISGSLFAVGSAIASIIPTARASI